MKDVWHKTLVYFGFADDVEADQVDEEEDETSDIFNMPPTVRKISRSAASRATHRSKSKTAHIRPVVSTQAKVHVVEPRNFNDAQKIADKFKIDIPVILNLQQIDSTLSKRILDFVSGLSYALDGGIQKVADKVFMLTPKNTEVSDEEKRRLQERGFFNQF